MKKMKVLALVMVFAFAALGGAYALWYDSLFIHETVNTGIVDLVWSDATSSDSSADGQDLSNVYAGSLDYMDPDNPNEAKNVGYKDVDIVADSETLPPFEGTDTRVNKDLLKIKVGNAYPGYSAYVDATIQNLGTIPTKFEVPAITDASGAAYTLPGWFSFDIYEVNDGAVGDLLWSSVSGDAGLAGLQIDPGDCLDVRIVETVHENYTPAGTESVTTGSAVCPQNANLEFNIQLKGIQWNEYNFPIN